MHLGTYKHYKGNLYEVIGLALHTETREKMVIYKALYKITDFRDLDEELGTDPYFVRPQKMFLENFTYVDNDK